MNAEADLEINVSWNVLEFYSGPRVSLPSPFVAMTDSSL